MTRERIEELANLRKEELTKEYEKDYRYKACKEYLQNNDISRIEDFANIDIFEFLRCAYYLNGSKWSIEEIGDMFNSFKAFLEATNTEDLDGFIKLTVSINAAGNIDNVINFLAGHNVFKSAMGLSGMIEENKSYMKTIRDLKKVNRCSDVNLVNYFKLYKEQGSKFLQLIAIYMAHRTMKLEADYINNELNELKNKHKALVIKKVYKDHYDTSLLLRDVSVIKKFVDEEEKKERQHLKNSNKEIFNINNSLSLLDKGLETEEITNAREIVNKIKDLELKYAVLELISEHNSKYHEKLDEELSHLNKNNKIKYQALLNDYGITNGSHQIERIMGNSLEDVEAMLKIITKFDLTTEQVIKILRNSNLDIVLQIKEYMDKGYLSIEFIINNIDMFYKNSTKYQVYNENLKTLNNYNINPSIFFYSIRILFDNTLLLKKNLELLNGYNLLNSLKTTSNYEFLSNDKLYLIIDKLIELGYENYLEEDLNLLNSDKLLRLEALKAFEVEISNKEELDGVLTRKFYIADEDLLDYLPGSIILDNKVDLDSVNLDDYRDTSRAYNINGTLISINKVNRLLEDGNSIYNAIFSEMRLNKEEYDSIISYLKGNTYHK
ncbi:MAG: hypothetical protein IJI58_05130 [Bacilli bacterium]|nr:hypothetical protein [Bacilli bacterium]